MKFLVIGFLSLTFVSAGVAQNKPADSDPVLKSSTTYSMPQSVMDAEIDGAVMVAIRVDETGNPAKAWLVTGPVWPCGENPVAALEDLSSTISATMMKLRFTPAIKNGESVTRDVGLSLNLKNPKLAPQPLGIDPVTNKPKPKQVSGGVLNGKAISLAKPAYPQEARANRDSGPVNIQVLIDEEGKVSRAGAISGAATLQRAARDAACRSKFSSTTLAGNPVKVSGVITYVFIP